MNFRNLFRLVFVIFFLYLVGDAFYRWDGAKYYVSFFGFLPSVALISILWSIVAVLATIIIWLFLKIVYWICRFASVRVSSEHVFLNTIFLLVIGGIVWASKKLIWHDVHTTMQAKYMVLAFVVLLSVFLTWLLRNKAGRLTGKLFDHITPLVWIFGIIVGLSIPVVTFYVAWEPSDKTIAAGLVENLEIETNRPNIILVTYDALTAKDMSVYGYHKETTPFISEWAKTATVFTRCEASANATYEAVPSLMTGKRVWSHLRFHSDAGEIANIEIESLPLLLKKSGYYNMAFTANEIASVKKLGMSESFDVKYSSNATTAPVSVYGFMRKYLVKYFGTEVKLYDWILKEDFILQILLPDNFIKYPYKNEYPVEKVFDMFLSEMDNNSQEPFFAWIHLFPPHVPYLPPEEYVGLFDTSSKFRTFKTQYDLLKPRYFTEDQQGDANIMRSRYDEFIRYCDKEFENFMKQLSLKNNLRNTVIILSSDHGESFEHGFFTHGSQTTLFEEMTHIPLIIKDLAQNEGRIIDFPVEMTDIPATILDLAHISVPLWMEGRSLAPLLRNEELQPRPVFSMFLEEVPVRGQIEINKGVVAVWEGTYKLIYNIASKESLLFNLKNDPDELNNLFGIEIEIGQHLLDLIQDNLERANERVKADKKS